MKKPLLFFVFILYCLFSSAQISGPNSGSTFSNVSISGSNQSWINTGNAMASDNSYASFDTLAGSSPLYTDYLQVTGFGFTIPGGVNITGIVLEVERSDDEERTADYRIRIVKNGTIGSSEMSSGAIYPSTDSYQTYGGLGNLWGETWAYTDINSPGFGVAIAAQSAYSGKNAGKVDHIRITVYYDFVILPVKLSALSAKRNRNVIDINWLANDESNMNRYEVERSVNGTQFITLDNVTGKNLSASTSYSTADLNPNRGINYYRLKMVENSGRITYSKIISVHFNSGKTVTLYPSPWTTGTELNITNPNAEEIQIEFYSMAGTLLGTSVSAGRTVPASILNNTKGLVLYRLRNKAGDLTGSGTLLVY